MSSRFDWVPDSRCWCPAGERASCHHPVSRCFPVCFLLFLSGLFLVSFWFPSVSLWFPLPGFVAPVQNQVQPSKTQDERCNETEPALFALRSFGRCACEHLCVAHGHCIQLFLATDLRQLSSSSFKMRVIASLACDAANTPPSNDSGCLLVSCSCPSRGLL